MNLEFDTAIGNKKPSDELIQLILELKDKVVSTYEQVEKIRKRAQKEGFNETQTKSLLRYYLRNVLKKYQIDYILYKKPAIEARKRLLEDKRNIPTDVNVPEPETLGIPTDYNVVVSEQVIEEESKQLQEQQEQPEIVQPQGEFIEKLDYALEGLRLELDGVRKQLEQEREVKKNLEEKYKQLEAKTRVSPSNNFPAVQGNTLRTKVVVNQVFKEVIQLKGARVIYANLVIEMSQNKYVRLEPLS